MKVILYSVQRQSNFVYHEDTVKFLPTMYEQAEQIKSFLSVLKNSASIPTKKLHRFKNKTDLLDQGICLRLLEIKIHITGVIHNRKTHLIRRKICLCTCLSSLFCPSSTIIACIKILSRKLLRKNNVK